MHVSQIERNGSVVQHREGPTSRQSVCSGH